MTKLMVWKWMCKTCFGKASAPVGILGGLYLNSLVSSFCSCRQVWVQHLEPFSDVLLGYKPAKLRIREALPDCPSHLTPAAAQSSNHLAAGDTVTIYLLGLIWHHLNKKVNRVQTNVSHITIFPLNLIFLGQFFKLIMVWCFITFFQIWTWFFFMCEFLFEARLISKHKSAWTRPLLISKNTFLSSN